MAGDSYPAAAPAMTASRYSRQMRVAGIGEAGQAALGRATVLIVGIGALGTHLAQTLARAGVGRLLLCDRDVVDLSNLQRQVLFDEADAQSGAPKAIAAAAALRRANSAIAIEPLVAHCSVELLRALPHRPDLVLDGTDNFPTRYLLNDWCRHERLPWIYGGAVGSEGTAMVVRSDGPCLRCLWPAPPPAGTADSCETAGALAPAIAAVTAFASAEAIQLLANGERATTRGLFTCDVLRGHYGVYAAAAEPAPECPVCARRAFPALDQPEPVTAVLCGRDAVQIDAPRRQGLDLDALAQRLTPVVTGLQRTPWYLKFCADGAELRVFANGRALLFGVNDPNRARALYDRWVGTN